LHEALDPQFAVRTDELQFKDTSSAFVNIIKLTEISKDEAVRI